jgi:hypothetical protein
MNKSIGIQLVVYGLLLAGLSYLAHHLAPTLARPTLIAGLAGGGLCLVWGLRALAGTGGKALPILTLIPVTFTLLSQTVMAWPAGGEGAAGGRTAAAVITLLLVLSIGMLMRIAYAGVVFDGGPASPAKDGGMKPPTASKPTGHANAGKRV